MAFTPRPVCTFVFLAALLSGLRGQVSDPLATCLVAFIRGYDGGNAVPELHITSAFATTGTVRQPQTGLVIPFVVVPGTPTVVYLPDSLVPDQSDVVQNRALLVEAGMPVSVVAWWNEAFAGDAAQVFPLAQLGERYRIISYPSNTGYPELRSAFVVAAASNGTVVTITPTTDTESGHPAGVPYSLALDAGQCVQVRAAETEDDLTGTLIETTGSLPCRGVAVFSGSSCSQVPANCGACNMLFEQLRPLPAHGTAHATVAFGPTNGHTLRVLAHEDSTTVQWPGGPLVLQAGEHAELNGVSTSHLITADKPVQVAAYLEGNSCANEGDPSLLLLEQTDQGTTSAVFSTLPLGTTVEHRIGLSTSMANAGLVLLDGQPIDPFLFEPYAEDSLLAHVDLAIDSGSHTLSAPLLFRAHAYGLRGGDAYAFNIGAATASSLYTDTVICHGGGPIVLDAPASMVQPVWSGASLADTLGTGPQFILVASTDTMVLVSDADTATCAALMHYFIEMPLQNVQLSVEPQQTCTNAPVRLEATASSPFPLNVLWQPTGFVEDPTARVTNAFPTDDTWFTAVLTSAHNCWSDHDSVWAAAVENDLAAAAILPSATGLCIDIPIAIEALAQRVIAFDPFVGQTEPFWNLVNAWLGAPCVPLSGDALNFTASGFRRAETASFALEHAAEVRFALVFGNGLNGCDDADPNDAIALEYSTNGGAQWTQVDTVQAADDGLWTFRRTVLPSTALTPATSLRWRQLGPPQLAGLDTWSLDNVTIITASSTGMSFAWEPSAWFDDATAPLTELTAANAATIHLTITDDLSGCTAYDSLAVVNAGPIQAVLPSDTLICSTASLPLVATGPTPGMQYTWYTSSGTLSSINANTATLNPDATAIVSIVSTNSAGCSVSDSMLVVVNTAPEDFSIGQAGNVICGGPAGAYDYQWYLNGLPIATPDTQCITIEEDGWYLLEVTASNGCMASGSGTFAVVGVNALSAPAPLVVVAEPGRLIAVARNELNGLQVTDAMGRVCATITGVIRPGERLEIPISAVGLFAIRASTGTGRFVSKVVVP